MEIRDGELKLWRGWAVLHSEASIFSIRYFLVQSVFSDEFASFSSNRAGQNLE